MTDAEKARVPLLMLVLLLTIGFWLAVYFFAVPVIAKAAGMAEQTVMLIVAALALVSGISAMRMAKSMAEKSAGEKNV